MGVTVFTNDKPMTKTESPGEMFSIDELLAFRDGADRHGRAPDLADIRALIDKAAAPYLARIAELEAENKALREAAAPKPYRYNPGPSFGDLCDPDFVASEGDRHNEEEL